MNEKSHWPLMVLKGLALVSGVSLLAVVVASACVGRKEPPPAAPAAAREADAAKDDHHFLHSTKAAMPGEMVDQAQQQLLPQANDPPGLGGSNTKRKDAGPTEVLPSTKAFFPPVKNGNQE